VAQPLNPQPDCLDFELLPATPLVPNAGSVRLYADATSGDLAAIKADGTSALPGGVPAGATGDVQFNNGGAFGNADSIFTGAIVNLDSNSNLIIDFSVAGGGLLFTVGSSDIHAAGNVSFESDQGDVSFTATNGNYQVSGLGFSISVFSGEGASIDTSSSSDPSNISLVAGAGAIALSAALVNIPTLQIFANNAAALSGGLVASNLYRTSTGQVMVVF
jgi:hypothetical protein